MDLWKRVRYCVEMEERRFDGLLKLYTKILFNTYPYSGPMYLYLLSIEDLVSRNQHLWNKNDRIFAACQSNKMNLPHLSVLF